MPNILITSAGRRVSLIRFFQAEVQKVIPEAKVYTSDANPEYSSACRISDGFFKVPMVTDPSYINSLLELAVRQNINLIIPTIDTELLLLAQNIDFFQSKGVTVVVSDYENVKIFRDKRLTHDFFAKCNIGYAQEYTKYNYRLPLYIKPYDGSRSVDNFVIRSQEQLTDYHLTNEKFMFLEYLDNEKHAEFTIDLYYDKKSNLKCLVPRQRIEVRDGEVNKAVTKDAFFIPEIWEKMKYIKGLRGCITFQIFVNLDTLQIYGIEINPRFGGGYPLSYLAKANFPAWIIREYLLQDKELPLFDKWEKNLMMLRYDDEILVSNFDIKDEAKKDSF